VSEVATVQFEKRERIDRQYILYFICRVKKFVPARSRKMPERKMAGSVLRLLSRPVLLATVVILGFGCPEQYSHALLQTPSFYPSRIIKRASSPVTTLHAKPPPQSPSSPSSKVNTEGASNTENESENDPAPRKEVPLRTYSAKFYEDNGLEITTDSEGVATARPKASPAETEEKGENGDSAEVVAIADEAAVSSEEAQSQHKKKKPAIQEQPAKIVPTSGFNVVLTHCTADFDSLASAVGLAKLWSCQNDREIVDKAKFDSSSHLPTFVVLPRGAHPSVQKFLALHKHLFPIRSLKSLPEDLSGLNRLGLVDAQRRERIGPAEHLLDYAKRITVVDHHLDSDSDIPEADDYVLDKVGSVSTLIVERLEEAELDEGLTEAEATLLALGIHGDTGSLCFDSTTPRDARALAWVMEQGASQTAIAEHAKSSLSQEQQGVLTQALINTNSTVVHGVTISTVLLTADGFINGLAAVTQDALELSSSDVYLLGLVYEPKSGGRSKKNKSMDPGDRIKTHLLKEDGDSQSAAVMQQLQQQSQEAEGNILETEALKGGDLMQQRLRASFDRKDLNGSGFLDKRELSTALASSGIIASEKSVSSLMEAMDTDGNGYVDFKEFVDFAEQSQNELSKPEKKSCTLIIIGRVKAGVNMKSIKLGKLLEERFGGGGHPKAASATVRLNEESDAPAIMSSLVDELVQSSLQEQSTVGEFMTSPVLSVRPDMTEQQVEDLFTRYDVRALPVVDETNEVIGLVSYKEVAAAKQRMWNKEQKRLRQAAKAKENGDSSQSESKKHKENQQQSMSDDARKKAEERRKKGSTVKAWMKQHVKTVEASRTMAEVEAILLANDVGCIPVVQDGTNKLVGMVTRTDLLRQHRYYPSLHYHNKGMSDSIAARQPIIELRRKLKKFDLDE
jgi:nanoRNase/pAp phosphatase (c-di-AMP/oligoRNAs hydrolase)